MHIKKVTKKDRYGNQVTTEYEVPEKSIDPTRLMEKQMELEQPDMTIEMMSAPVGGEEFQMGDPMNHPGEPRGQDTVPAWLTPGEFVVNAEAMSVPGMAQQVEQINEVGRMMKNGGMVQQHHRMPGGHMMAGAYHNTGGMIDDAMDFAGPESLSDADIQARMEAMRAASQPEAAPVPVPDMPVPVDPTTALLHAREGYRPDIYLDSLNKPTVGYGHLLGDEYASQVGESPFSEKELKGMFEEDRSKAIQAARSNVGEDTYNKLNKQQQTALNSMAFQLGAGGQRKFKKMLEAIRKGDHAAVAREALTGSKGGKSKWYRQTPKRAMDLAMAFDPDMAAQYQNAGGVVYRDDGGWGSWLKNTANKYILGSKNQIPMPAATVPNPNPPSPRGRFPAPVPGPAPGTPWGNELLPGDNRGGPRVYDMDPSQIFQGDGAPMPERTWADNQLGLDFTGTGQDKTIDFSLGEPPAPTEVPAVQNSVTEDMGLLGNVVDWFGGPSDAAQVEHEERQAQQNRAAEADLTKQQEEYEAAAGIAAAEADELLAAGDYEGYVSKREEAERMGRAAASTGEDITAVQDEADADEAAHIANASARAHQKMMDQLAGMEEAKAAALAAGDEKAAAEIQHAMDTLTPEAIYMSDPGYTPDGTDKVEVKKPTKEEAGSRLDALITAPPGEDETGPGEDQPGDNNNETTVTQAGETEANNNPPAVTETKSMLQETFGDLFSGKELLKTAVMYLGSRALGYSHNGSLRWAAQQHLAGAQGREAARAAATAKREENAFELAKSGKYSPESVEAYRRTGNLSALTGGQQRTATGKTMARTINGQKVVYQEVKTPDGNTMYVGPDGKAHLAASIEQNTQAYAPAFEKGTPEYRARRSRATSDAAGRFEEVFKNQDTFRTGSGHNTQVHHHTDIRPKQAADEFWAFAEKHGLDPESDEALTVMTNAYQAAIADGQNSDKVKPSRLTPYLEGEMIREKIGDATLMTVNQAEVDSGKERPRYVRQDKMNELDDNVAALVAVSPVEGLTSSQVYSEMQAAWSGMDQQERNRYNNSAQPGVTSGFYVFVNEKLGALYQQLQSQ